MGDDGRIVAVSAKLKGPFFKGNTLTALARVSAINAAGDETLVDLDLSQTDESDRAIAVGTAQVSFDQRTG